MGNALEPWLDSLSPENRAMIDPLRAIVRSAAPTLVETIKWNAPNFADADQDRVTLGIERNGGVRMVLHRGATVKDATAFVFEDPDRLARWPTPDRGVMAFSDPASISARAVALERLVGRWIEANRQA